MTYGKRIHLGDGIYAEYLPNHIRLTVDNEMDLTTIAICLTAENLARLLVFATPANQQEEK